MQHLQFFPFYFILLLLLYFTLFSILKLFLTPHTSLLGFFSVFHQGGEGREEGLSEWLHGFSFLVGFKTTAITYAGPL